MNGRRSSIFERWPTGVILLLLLTAALLPLGLVLAWAANEGVRDTDEANAASVKTGAQGFIEGIQHEG